LPADLKGDNAEESTRDADCEDLFLWRYEEDVLAGDF